LVEHDEGDDDGDEEEEEDELGMRWQYIYIA
jgi:hypothetical protein